MLTSCEPVNATPRFLQNFEEHLQGQQRKDWDGFFLDMLSMMLEHVSLVRQFVTENNDDEKPQ